MNRDIKSAAAQLRANLQAKYGAFFDKHGCYFAIQARIDEMQAKDVASFVSSMSMSELGEFADAWGADNEAEGENG